MTAKWASAGAAPRLRDAWFATAVGFVVRLAVVFWASTRFPPSDDGHFYHVLATRLASGLGYTWAWPDGTVTFAAHYPVGYPALLACAYALFGAHPATAMTLNAVLGAASVYAVHRVAATRANRAGALLAAFGVALHPGLVWYTPALMTEGITGALLVLTAWIVCAQKAATDSSKRWLVPLGLLLGLTTLVRPQSLLVAPLFGFLFAKGAARWTARVGAATVVTALALAVCAPWTVRNCRRMEACVLVSANAGWNLFIGAAPGATGSWVSIDELGVPQECRTVWGEAQKDACFERAGLLAIRNDPIHFLLLVPKKLAATFDYAGAAGWYLHSSNPAAFDDGDKLVLGIVETGWQRLIVLAALVAVARIRGPRTRARRVLSVMSAATLFSRAAWLAHVGLVGVVALLGGRLARSPVAAVGAGVVLTTLVAHGVFFGAGRYSLVCFPALAALAGTALTAPRSPSDTVSL